MKITGSVLMRFRSGFVSPSPSAVRITAITVLTIRAVDTVVFTPRISFLPKYLAVMTDVPILHPKATAMNKSVISYPLPTAASASVPVSYTHLTLPTT